MTEGLMQVPDEDAISPKPKGWQISFPTTFWKFAQGTIIFDEPI